MPDDPVNYIPRAQVLTQKDLEQLSHLLAIQFESHTCKFGQVTHDQMDKVVRLSNFFERFEKKVLDGITYSVLVVICGIVYLMYDHGLFRSR